VNPAPALLRSTAARLIAGWLGLVAIGCLIGWLLTTFSAGWELHALRRVAEIRTPTLTDVADAATTIGSVIVLVPVAAVAGLALLVRNDIAAMIALAADVAGVLTWVNLIKVIVDRHRPTVTHLTVVHSPSFPSAHAAQATTILVALALVLPWRRIRVVALLLAIALAALVGLSRIYLGVHYPSDVVAGWLLGAVWLGTVRRACRRRAETAPTRAPS